MIWVVCVITVLEASSIYILALYRQEGGHLTVAADHITPVTLTAAVVAFFVIAYLARQQRVLGRCWERHCGDDRCTDDLRTPLRSHRDGANSPPAPGTLLILLFFVPLILVEILSLVMLTFSPVMKLSRATLFLLAGMFVIFAVWAMFGFTYPATPLPIALNMISKVLAFAAAVSLFLPAEQSAWFARQPVPASQESAQ